jgi:hypothetical protein
LPQAGVGRIFSQSLRVHPEPVRAKFHHFRLGQALDSNLPGIVWLEEGERYMVIGMHLDGHARLVAHRDHVMRFDVRFHGRIPHAKMVQRMLAAQPAGAFSSLVNTI